jgi:cytochrome P450
VTCQQGLTPVESQALVEMAEALPILVARLRAPALAGEVPWRPALGICGPLTLPIRFHAAT